jgi:hypothetical protein
MQEHGGDLLREDLQHVHRVRLLRQVPRARRAQRPHPVLIRRCVLYVRVVSKWKATRVILW